MRYRLYHRDDFNNLYAIEEVCFSPPQRFTRRYMSQLVNSPNTATWIAEQDETKAGNSMLGFAILEWMQQVSGIVAYIATIEVISAWRGHGIGAELMRRLEGSAIEQRAIAIWLHADPANAPAIHLYERNGFCKSGRAEDYYARNRPAAIYVKHLV